MRILIAPNAFKNSLDAATAARAIREGLEESHLACICECFPVGDGGDGTGRLLIERLGGHFEQTTVSDPLGRSVNAFYGVADQGGTAVIEMAEASGMRLLKNDELNPMKAASDGTGDLIKAALDRFPIKRIIITMGGSATVDGGSGILRALGARFLSQDGNELSDLPFGLRNLSSVDLSQLDQRILGCEVVVLCDVENKLLGEEGAAAVFGPQKGASKEDVPLLEEGLRRFKEVALDLTGKDMSVVLRGGVAGGAAAGLWAFLNASLVNGIQYYLDISGFQDALRRSDLVITGEGSIDSQTLKGKGPFGVAVMAKREGVPVIGLAGKVPLTENQDLQRYFDVLMPIGNEPMTVDTATKVTYENLVRTGFNIGNLLALR